MSPATAAQRKTAERRAGAARRARASTPTGFRFNACGARFALFGYHYLRHAKGRWAGSPLAFEPWQLEIYSELLEVEHDVWRDLTLGDLRLSPHEFWAMLQRWLLEDGADARGLRIHNEGLIGTPKKNAKSTGAAGLMLYLLTSDGEEGPEVYSLASSRDQARIVFNAARTMVEKSPRLLEILRIGRGHTTTSIFHPASDGVYRAIAHDAGLQEGMNPSAASVDEIHTHPSRALYDTVRSAMVAREQALLVGLTTAGVTFKAKGGAELNLLGDLYQRGAGKRPKYVLRKLHPEIERHGHKAELSYLEPHPAKSRRFYFRWFEVPWPKREQPRYWRAANPIAYMDTEKLQDESDVERPRGIFYRYHLNITTSVEKHWLPSGKLAKCRAPKLRIRRDDDVIVTVDIGLSYDTTAVTLTRPAKPGERLITRSLILGVHDDPKAPPPPAHVLLSESPVDLDVVENLVRAISTGDYDGLLPEEISDGAHAQLGMRQGEPLTVIMVAADPHKFETQLQHLDEEGLQVLRFSQGDPMTLASEALYREITSKDAPLATDGDPITEAHFENAAARDVGGGKWRLDKKRADDKMDAAVSTAMGVYLARDPEIADPPSPGVSIL